MKIALGQISATKDVAKNLQQVREYTAQAKDHGASFIVFPEATMIAFGGRLHDEVVDAQEQWNREIQEIARENDITILAGAFAPEENTDPEKPRVINQLVVVKPEGIETAYHKIHLYDALGFNESDGVVAGNELKTTDIDGVRVGLTLCYDVRFPKLYAELSRAGAQIIVVPASWAGGDFKVNQWQMLTGARALDSNTFVVAVDQADPKAVDPNADDDGPFGVGYSRVISPFGKIIAELGEGEELAVVELDLDLVNQARESLPVLKNAKLGY